MSSRFVYRASFYLMMTVSAIALCVDPADSRLGWLPPPLVAAAGVAALLTVDRNPSWGLPQGLAKMLALGTIGLLYLEYSMDETELVRALGHWLIALQLIKYFLPKTAADDWFIFLVGLMQVLIGSVINTGDQVGIWLFIWAVLAVWVLGQFFLQREARRFAPEPGPDAAPAPPREDPYPGLFDRGYFYATVRVMAVSLALGFLAFLLIPRQPGQARSRYGATTSQHLTGFDEEVSLGQLGEILENDDPVMTIEFADVDGDPVPPPVEPLWRGVTLNTYENGRWRKQSSRSLRTFPAIRTSLLARRNALRQIIRLEANDSPTLFAIRPMLAVTTAAGPRIPPSLNMTDGTIIRQSARGPLDYEAYSDPDPSAPQIGEEDPSPRRLRETLLAVPPDLKPRLRAIAEPLVEGLPDDDGLEATRARAKALESYLLNPVNFGYSLAMRRIDSNLDPVEDFLVNRREGHCEYFASALALLLRSIDIPSRMVNGFKGGDWNDITQTMTVRGKHAHSWVEAYAGVDDEGDPIWIVLDPTPGAERERSIAQIGGLAARLRIITDLIRHVWVFYIQGYNSDRQNKLLYEPLSMLAREVRALSLAGWNGLTDAVARLFRFQNFRSFISVKGFVVSFLVLLALAALAKLCVWLFGRFLSWWRGADENDPGATAGILFYRRLVQLLAGYDLKRSPAETQNEFARRAFQFLSGREADAPDVAESPQKIVDAFYQVRFGHQELPPETLAELERRLDVLEAALKPSTGN